MPDERPLRRLLDDAHDERDVMRWWRSIETRRARRVPSRSWQLASACAVTGVMGVAVAWALAASSEPSSDGSMTTQPAATGAERPPSTRAAPEPLRLAGGRPLEPGKAWEPPGDAEKPVIASFSDGSRIRVHPGAHLEPLVTTGNRFVSVLRRGSASFEVQPGGPRHWIVEAGAATVEVVGTRFRVSRLSDAVTVSVTKGVVLVRGPGVPDRVQRLEAGQRLRVGAPAEEHAGPSEPSVEPAAPQASTHEDRPEDLAGRVRKTRDPDALLRLADLARRRGEGRTAIAALERVLALGGEDSRVALAAFTLGRLELEQNARPKRAARAFERAIAIGAPEGLREDCHARLVEAYTRAGMREAATRAAATYLRHFPDGRRRGEVEQWIGSTR